MKIDSHVHITPPDIIKNWKKYAEKEAYFSMITQSKVNKFAEAEDVITDMEKEGFDRAVVFGFAFSDMGLCRYVNDYVIEKVNQFPDKLIGFAVVCAGGKETQREIERCHNAGLKGVGELFPAGQGASLKSRIDLEDKEQLKTITEVCKERDIPLLLHVNEPIGHNYPGKTDVPLQKIEKFIFNNIGLKIILAHFGGGILFYETMKEIKEAFNNVYYDTAACPFLYDNRIYGIIKALGICDKILFGSDYPILPQSRYLNALEESSLSDEERQLIMGKNAQRLLTLF
ncbi:MAG: amidohydrolase [Treponema sp.]|nr:amidohydrolase [Treponema sp.]